MTADSSKGFFCSVFLHGGVVALLFLTAYIAKQQPDAVKVFELVAGEGDNFGAKVAPAYGVEGGAKMTVPIPPAPTPKPEPAPVTPAPPTPTPPVKQEVKPTPTVTEPPQPNFAKQIKRTVTRATDKAKKDVKKEQDAEAKKAAAEAKKAAEDQKKMTKEEFDRQNKTTSSPTKVAQNTKSVKAPKIDTEGIRKGVLGGSTENKVGGAGGKALTATEGTLAERYMEMLKERLRNELEPRSNTLDEGLRAEAEFHLMADGRITRARIIKSSGNDAFDAAVLVSIATIKMPARPKGVDELQQFPFVTSPKDRR